MLSRPGFERRYLHSTGNREFDPRVQFYADFDLSHIQEKLHEWTNQRKTQRKKINKDEPVASTILSDGRVAEPVFQSPSEETLGRRLAKANTKRREQLLYWSRHPDVRPDSPQLSDRLKIQSAIPRNHVAELPPSHKGDAESHAPTTSTTLRTFSKVPASDAFYMQTKDGHTRTEYKKSKFGRKTSNRVPDLPVIWRKDSVDCPFCHIGLKSLQMKKRDEWK